MAMPLSASDEDICGIAPSGGAESFCGGASDSCSSSVPMRCSGCGVSSKSIDPIEQHKTPGSTARRAWGQASKRKLRTRSGRNIKSPIRYGEWCRVCYNLARRRASLRTHRKGKGKDQVLPTIALQAVKTELEKDNDKHERFKSASLKTSA